MKLVQRSLVELAWTHAMTATQETRVAREHSLEQRIAWSHWWDRWHELERDEPSERTLVVCATCSRYRDGAGRFED